MRYQVSNCKHLKEHQLVRVGSDV